MTKAVTVDKRFNTPPYSYVLCCGKLPMAVNAGFSLEYEEIAKLQFLRFLLLKNVFSQSFDEKMQELRQN